MSEEASIEPETAENLVSDDISVSNVRSFDELEAATSNKTPEELLQQSSKAVEKRNREMERSKERAAKMRETGEIDTSKTEARTTKNASEKQPQEAAQELSEDAETDMAEELKMLKAARGDTEYELPEDAELTVKIDGEEVKVPISELRNNYSGKTAWDKKFTELDQERKEYLEDRRLVERYVGEFRELAQSENKVAALEYLAQLSGQNPIEFRRELESQMFEKFQQMQGLSESEIKAMQLQEENEFLQRQRESDARRVSESQARQEAEAKLMDLQEAHNLTNDDIANLYDQVLQGSNEPLSDEQILQAMDQVALNNRATQGAEYLLGQVNKDLVDDSNVQAVTELIMENPTWTEEDFIDVIRDAMGTEEAKKVSKKAKQAAKPAEKKQVKQQKSYDAPASFDDL